jgi:hypothetical protein
VFVNPGRSHGGRSHLFIGVPKNMGGGGGGGGGGRGGGRGAIGLMMHSHLMLNQC